MSSSLTIDSAEIRLIELPLLNPFTISSGTMYNKVFPLLTLRSGHLEGYGEGVMDLLPNYLEDTIPGALDLAEKAILPKAMGKSFDNPAMFAEMLEPWRGHWMTKAMFETAFWDLWAKSLQLPLSTLLGGLRRSVPVGVSLGIDEINATVEKAKAHVAQGYQRIKLKIKPGHDLGLVRAVRKALPDTPLTVDANTAYSLSDMNLMYALDELNLDYIEQPLAYDDLHDHAALQARLRTAICLDESIRSAKDARKALETDAARVINIKVGRVGGFSEALRIHDIAAAFDVPVWCGGMLEAGVGRAHNIHLASLPNFSLPGDTSSSSRYFKTDIVNEPLETENGVMPVPSGPGIGVTLNREFLSASTSWSIER
ncbi:o-succinylbenzoate synthase [Sulfitobacter sp. S0837]|uniref:o-succinylbenzoate synthase n=1 Tax=Sulfitobacter maritimus TaxID=2741719 RepID=UPI001581DEA3|nr:o-succinylbenzoate synthase [Sulfitobacter maritimus]NUH63732.1 o-succinylbenzoate synthase [Sulfitobacter maritimus]NUH63794.1 o-succinylbenzoate synthase [Sulfitobacter maritimus]NUH65579.1 o-succinylbenzoate synthase [Sulfitobacter maritimus]